MYAHRPHRRSFCVPRKAPAQVRLAHFETLPSRGRGAPRGVVAVALSVFAMALFFALGARAADGPAELFGAASDGTEAPDGADGSENILPSGPAGARDPDASTMGVAPTAPVAPPAPAAIAAPVAPGAYVGGPAAEGPAIGPGAGQAPAGVDLFPPGAGGGREVAATQDPPARVGRLGLFEGRVSVRAGAPGSGAGGVWLEASRNRPVVAGDSIWADANSRAELHLGSLEVRLGANTLVQVLLLDDTHVRLGLLQGAATLRRHPQGAGEVEVDVPGLTAALESAGDYRLDVGVDGTLHNLQATGGGRARVRGEAQDLRVESDHRLQAQNDAGQGLQLQPAEPSRDALATWSAQRAQAQNTAASLRYVSRDMVGYEDLDGYGAWTSSPTYGPLWAPRDLATGWAPFRFGQWAYVSPWGWTWVDDAPWGFAPFHYGRWVSLRGRWYWAPGAYAAYPVYAPHLVAFAGGAGFGGVGLGLGLGGGAYVGWYPLGFYDPYYPGYACSYGYARGINGARPLPHFNPGGPHLAGGPRGIGGPRVPGSVTVVPRGTVLGGLPVGANHRPVDPRAYGRAGWGGRMPVAWAGAAATDTAAARPPTGGDARGGAVVPPSSAWGRGSLGGRPPSAGGHGPVVLGSGGGPLGGAGPGVPGPSHGGARPLGPAFGPGARPQSFGGYGGPGGGPGGYPTLPAFRFEPHGGGHFGGGHGGATFGHNNFGGGAHFGGGPHFGGGHGGGHR